MAGVHTHQVAASICAAARVSVPTPFGEVPCAPYALPGTKKITEGTVGALGEGPRCSWPTTGRSRSATASTRPSIG